MNSIFGKSRLARAYLAPAGEGWNASTLIAPNTVMGRDGFGRPGPDKSDPRRTTPQATATADQKQRSADLSVIEARHPEIVKAMAMLWGYPEMNEYFNRLWLADGNHPPLDPDAMSELMLLARLHQDIVPQRPGHSLAALYGGNRVNEPSPGDPWGNIPTRR